MRSITFTLLLALAAAAVCGVIGWQIKEGNLDAILGVPPVPPGDRLYKDFHPTDVARISVSAHSVRADFIKTETGWRSASVPRDRMDPRYAGAIVAFTLNLKVLDSAETDEIDRDGAGLREDSIQIRLETASGESLARYRIGRRTPLQSENPQGGPPDPSVYIQPRESDRRDHVYACTGDITPLFRDGLKFLRDHRPFFINPNYLQKIRLRGPEGELTLGHSEPGEKAPWRIAKPLDLPTDRPAMLALLNGLVELTATRIADRSAVTLPSPEAGARSLQVGLTTFGQDTETLLEVFPPDSPEATEALATVSDRPDTVFYLPVKEGTATPVSLPVTVNELRNRSLLNIDLTALRSITITPLTGNPIHISGEPKRNWQVEIGGKTQEANQLRLLTLLETLTSTRALNFESDAATDFTPWGLNKPFLVLTVAGEDGNPIRLNFGMDKRAGVFVNRAGTPTVMSVDDKILRAIPVQPFEWRHARLWSVSAVDLKSIGRTVRDGPPLLLNYDFNDEKWTGTANGEDVTNRIDPLKAKYMLDSLVGLNVSRWLAVNDADAATALASPVFTLTVTEKVVDEFGDETGAENRRALTLAPVPGDTSYYGRMSAEPHPFVIDRETAVKIGTDPLENHP